MKTDFTLEQIQSLSLENLLELFPDNYSLYKDSGSWTIYDDFDMEYSCQDSQEIYRGDTLQKFLARFIHNLALVETPDSEGFYNLNCDIAVAIYVEKVK